jgi:hypothetical protein
MEIIIFFTKPRAHNGERAVFSTNGIGKTEYPYAKE